MSDEQQTWGVSTFEVVASLASARLRLGWAAKRLRQIVDLQAGMQAAFSGARVRQEWDRDPFERQNRLENVQTDLPLPSPEAAGLGDLQMFAGETIYHLRTILDYVAYNAAWLDSGYERKGTAFPVIRDKAGWPDAKRRLLKGCTKTHIAVLEEYQPFSGCAWTLRLNELANQDKHRTWFDVPFRLSGSGRLGEIAEGVPGRPDRLQAEYALAPPVYVLPDDDPLVDLLQGLHDEVDGLLRRLEPEFPPKNWKPALNYEESG